MKRFLIILAFVAYCATNTYAQSSPYVEPGSLVINNSGFRHVSIRLLPLLTPTPMHTQDSPINETFPNRFVVAKTDLLQNGTWAWVNGWTTASNISLSGGVVSLILTGCVAYFEIGLNAGIGMWRVPTQREMMIIQIARHELAIQNVFGFTAISNDKYYWTSTQSNASTAWVFGISAATMYNNNKSVSYSARCIRDL